MLCQPGSDMTDSQPHCRAPKVRKLKSEQEVSLLRETGFMHMFQHADRQRTASCREHAMGRDRSRTRLMSAQVITILRLISLLLFLLLF